MRPSEWVARRGAHCHFGLGELYHRTDKREPAREHLAIVMTMYRELGMTKRIVKVLGVVNSAAGSLTSQSSPSAFSPSQLAHAAAFA